MQEFCFVGVEREARGIVRSLSFVRILTAVLRTVQCPSAWRASVPLFTERTRDRTIRDFKKRKPPRKGRYLLQ